MHVRQEKGAAMPWRVSGGERPRAFKSRAAAWRYVAREEGWDDERVYPRPSDTPSLPDPWWQTR